MDRSPSGIARSIRLAREGQPEALSDLLEAHRNYLRLLAASCLHREMQGKADPSDVVQETLLKVHENFRQFRGTTELEWMSWLRKILVHQLTDIQKGFQRQRRKVSRERSLEGHMDRSSAMLRNLVPAAGPSPSQEAQRREAAALVADALAELEPEDRDVVILRNLHELDWNAVGEKTGRSPDAARMLWARAMQRVGGLLKGRVS
ncbi:MAG: sigma-70 family RNA polymerase sigma factor [Planctomycetota bacterium]